MLVLAQFQVYDFDAAMPGIEALLGQVPEDIELRRAALAMAVATDQRTVALARAAELEALGDREYAALYQGRLAERSGEADSAESHYRQALASRDAALAQQAADHLINLLQEAGRHDEVREVARTAVSRDPASFDAYRFEQYLAEEPGSVHGFAASVGYRLDHDDNVALLPDAQGFFFGVPDEEDFRHVLFADLAWNRPLGTHLTLFTEGHFSHSIHHDLDQYDFTRANVLVGLGGDHRAWGWRLPAEYTHDRFDGDAFRDSVFVTPGIYFNLWQGLQAHVYFRYQSSDYDRSVSLAEDRSGDAEGGGVLLLGTLGERWFVRVYAEMDEFDTDGANWDRDEWRAQARLEFSLAPGWTLGAGALYQEAEFDNLHSIFLAPREDETSQGFVSLEHNFRERWNFRAQVSYVEQESTLPLYDYDRTVISLGVSYDF